MNDLELTLFLEAHTDNVIKELGKYSKLDAYLLKDGELNGFLERKTRNVSIGKYDTAIIDYEKFLAMHKVEAATELKCWLAVGWSCGTVGVVQPTRCPVKVEMVTPSETSVSLNKGVTREVAHIEIRRFEILGTVA